MQIALLFLHVVVGCLFAAHGAQKVFGIFGGHGLEGTAGFFDQIGLRPGAFHARVAGFAELFGGILLALGLFTPIAAALLIAVMVVAVATVHFKNGLWNTNQGWEFNLVLVVALFVLAATGGGRLALDHWLSLGMNGNAWGLGALGAGILGGVGAIAAARISGRERRYRHPAHPTAA
jgi:putative oxidoreductase